ncbi:hypothetical protein [Marinobacter halophilus]|uniref:hypothetical protein n=1 Tax=Marinobacter halophilus TaxID=1323740 RepID=UPI001056E760|nr:hypothetical protein [Marinobacter halophilus]
MSDWLSVFTLLHPITRLFFVNDVLVQRLHAEPTVCIFTPGPSVLKAPILGWRVVGHEKIEDRSNYRYDSHAANGNLECKMLIASPNLGQKEKRHDSGADRYD